MDGEDGQVLVCEDVAYLELFELVEPLGVLLPELQGPVEVDVAPVPTAPRPLGLSVHLGSYVGEEVVQVVAPLRVHHRPVPGDRGGVHPDLLEVGGGPLGVHVLTVDDVRAGHAGAVDAQDVVRVLLRVRIGPIPVLGHEGCPVGHVQVEGVAVIGHVYVQVVVAGAAREAQVLGGLGVHDAVGTPLLDPEVVGFQYHGVQHPLPVEPPGGGHAVEPKVHVATMRPPVYGPFRGPIVVVHLDPVSVLHRPEDHQLSGPPRIVRVGEEEEPPPPPPGEAPVYVLHVQVPHELLGGASQHLPFVSGVPSGPDLPLLLDHVQWIPRSIDKFAAGGQPKDGSPFEERSRSVYKGSRRFSVSATAGNEAACRAFFPIPPSKRNYWNYPRFLPPLRPSCPHFQILCSELRARSPSRHPTGTLRITIGACGSSFS